MSRTLHTNVRSFKEPFKLLITQMNIVNGIDLGNTFYQYDMFGLILNKSVFVNDNYNISYKNTIAIKIIKPMFDIKINDKVKYRGAYYNIISITWDMYSRNEIMINCEYLDDKLWAKNVKIERSKNNS